MTGSDKCVYVWFCVIFIYSIICPVLQIVAFFTPAWASTSLCEKQGLFYSCCTVNSTTSNFAEVNCGVDSVYFSADAFHLEAVAVAVNMFVVFTLFLISYFICADNKSENTCCSCSLYLSVLVAMLFYPIAIILSFEASTAIINHPDATAIGYSTYLSLVSGILVYVQVLFFFIAMCVVLNLKGDSEEEASPDRVNDNNTQPQDIQISVIDEINQTVVVEEETKF